MLFLFCKITEKRKKNCSFDISFKSQNSLWSRKMHFRPTLVYDFCQSDFKKRNPLKFL